MRYLLFILSLFFFACSSSTETNKPTESAIDSSATSFSEPNTPIKTMEDFVLEGHEILASQKADLNGDQKEDVILLLKANNEEEISDYASDKPCPRPLLLLVGDENGSLTLAARNDKAAYCIDCGGQMGDPFSAIIVDGAYFTLEHYGGSAQRWARIVTFTFAPNKDSWILYQDGTESFDAGSPKELSTSNNPTANISFEEFDIYK